MTDAALPVPATSSYTGVIERVWPDHGRAMRPISLALATVAGLGAATLLPMTEGPGLGMLSVVVLLAASAVPTALPRVGVHEVAYGALATPLLSVVVLRDAEWLAALCLLGTAATASYALIGGRTIVGAVLASMSLPMAGLRALPWIGRGVRSRLPRGQAWGPSLRTVATSVGLLVVFGALFASADAVFASLLPSVDLADLPGRTTVFVVFTGLALATAFLAAAPPRWDALSPAPARAVRPIEWIAPISGLVALFAVFVGVQVTVLLGGDDYVLRTAGLTYAEHARSGFGQLVVVTLLTLAVVSAAVRWAPRETPARRRVLRLLLGALCLLALAVVVFALHRLHLYEEAFGFTRLRLFMNVFEGWLGVLLVMVLLAGVRLRARWLPGAVVVTAAAALLGLAAINPDGFIADRNVARFESTGKVDIAYLRLLSADAVPAIDRLPEPERSCALAGISVPDDGLAGWNVGRDRAREILGTASGAATPGCTGLSSLPRTP